MSRQPRCEAAVSYPGFLVCLWRARRWAAVHSASVRSASLGTGKASRSEFSHRGRPPTAVHVSGYGRPGISAFAPLSE